VHGRQLDQLQLAEAWLEDHLQADAPPAVAHCPSADELYDHARGPGAAPLASDRRAQIDRHLARCRPCESVATELRSRPPVPIADLPSAEALDDLDRSLVREICEPPPIERLEKIPTLLRWIPLAAAASLVAFLAFNGNRQEAGRLPITEAVRGDADAALISPGGPLLYVPAGASIALFDAGCTPRFELAAVADATEYVVQIFRHAGGALESGELIATLRGTEPDLGTIPLEPARYTWRARAMVLGLDTELGAREIQVVARPALLAELNGKRTADAIVLLHDEGFRADARRLARTMPASPERDAYLGLEPGASR